MKSRFFGVATILMLLGYATLITNQVIAGEHSAKLTTSIGTGYFGGPGFQTSMTISDISDQVPVGFSIGLGYTSVYPGKAADARKIFINNATNGTPDKSGQIWDLRLDLVVPARLLPFGRSFLTFGPRYSMFTGNFEFIGGNEVFSVTSDQWGFGAGVGSGLEISPRFDLVLAVGVDYYFKSSLVGHDTSYNPDGEDVNPREDYDYNDADDAINQPGIEPQVMFGVRYKF